MGKNPKKEIIYYFFFPQTQNIISFIQQVFYLLRFLQDILTKNCWANPLCSQLVSNFKSLGHVLNLWSIHEKQRALQGGFVYFMQILQWYSGHSKDTVDTPKIQSWKPISCFCFAYISVNPEYLLKENELRYVFSQLVLEIPAQLHVKYYNPTLRDSLNLMIQFQGLLDPPPTKNKT